MSKQLLVDDLPIVNAELPVLLPIRIQPLVALSNDNAMLSHCLIVLYAVQTSVVLFRTSYSRM